MSAETAHPPFYYDGEVTIASLRWPWLYDAMCSVENNAQDPETGEVTITKGIAPTIDLAELAAYYSDEQINDDWMATKDYIRRTHGRAPNYAEVLDFAKPRFQFPDRSPHIHEKIPGETIGMLNERVIRGSLRTAGAKNTSQIGSEHEAFEATGRFHNNNPDTGVFYGWDQGPTCRAALTMGPWGQAAVGSTLRNREDVAKQNEGYIGNANVAWGATRNQPPLELRILFQLAESLHPLPENFSSLTEAEKEEVNRQVQRARNEVIIRDLDFHEACYMVWRDGLDQLGTEVGSKYKHLVRMPNGSFAFKHYDRATGPRDEMREADLDELREWATDNGGVAPSEAEAMEFFQGMREEAADGEDFNAKNQRNRKKLYTKFTAQLAPVKLNAIQYDNARKLAYANWQKAAMAAEAGDHEAEFIAVQKATFFEADADMLEKNLLEFFIADNGLPADFNFVLQETQSGEALRCVFALNTDIFEQSVASQMLDKVEELFGRKGGLVNTLIEDSPQQWDNNCWAIMQMEAIDAAIRHKRFDLALLWTRRWLHNNDEMFAKYHALFEKSSPNGHGEPGGGGEYDCVPNLPMSAAVDIILRELLGRLEAMQQYGPNEKSGRGLVERPLGYVSMHALVSRDVTLQHQPKMVLV